MEFQNCRFVTGKIITVRHYGRTQPVMNNPL